MVQKLVEKAFAIGKTRILSERHTLHTVKRENQAGEMQIQNTGELKDIGKHGHIASRIQTVVENLKETLQLSEIRNSAVASEQARRHGSMKTK